MLTTEQCSRALPISLREYTLLHNPQFLGQTRVQADGTYKVYWACDNKIYVTTNSLLLKEEAAP